VRGEVGEDRRVAEERALLQRDPVEKLLLEHRVRRDPSRAGVEGVVRVRRALLERLMEAPLGELVHAQPVTALEQRGELADAHPWPVRPGRTTSSSTT